MSSRPPTYAQVSSSPSLEDDKLGLEEEVPRLVIENDVGLVLSEVTGQHGKTSHEVSQEPQSTSESANEPPHTFSVVNGDQLEELQQDDIWALVDAMPSATTSVEFLQSETISELLESYSVGWDLESEFGLGAQPKEPLPDHVWDDLLETTNESNAGSMEKHTKRARGSNWNHAHTMALAELKREASLNEEHGPLAWERIAQTLSSRFPDQIRTGDQCRRRWDTLVKVYNHIEDYCVQTGAQDHRELDEGELASMKLDTAYQQDWYDIVEQVCNQRKRKEKCDRDHMLAKRSKSSYSVELPERPPNRDILCSASTSNSGTYHEQAAPESTTTYRQASSGPSLEADKLNPEEEFPRLRNGNDGLVHEVKQRRQHRQVSHDVSQEPETLESANELPHTFPAESGVQLKEPLQNDLWAWDDELPFGTSAELEQSETEWWDLELGGLGVWLNDLPQDHVVTYTAQGGFLPIEMHNLIGTVDRRRSSTDDDCYIRILPDSRRWSLKVVLLKIRHSCLACGRKERVEDLEMESKQAARLKEKALMPRKENVPAELNARNSPSAASATRGDKPLQKDTERISKQAALDKKEEETRPRKAPERQQLGGKSASKWVPVGKWCAKWSRKLRFPAFHGEPGSH